MGLSFSIIQAPFLIEEFEEGLLLRFRGALMPQHNDTRPAYLCVLSEI